MVFQSIATPSAELEYVSDRNGRFKRPWGRCKLLTCWAFEFFDQTGYHDVGLAVSQLIVQATLLSLHVHQMAGFDVVKARETYGIPEGFDPVAVLAIGYSAEDMSASRTRRPQDEIAFTGKWGEAY